MLIFASAGIILTMVAATVRWYPGKTFQLLLLFATVVSIANILLSQRVLRYANDSLEVFSDAEPGAGLYGKLLLAVLICCSLSMCIGWWIKQECRPSRNFYICAFVQRADCKPRL